jgi:hypothetical protein
VRARRPAGRREQRGASRREHQQAVDRYRQALDLFAEMGDQHAEAIALDHLGDTYQAMGERASAHEVWRRALDTLVQLGHPDADAVRAKLR